MQRQLIVLALVVGQIIVRINLDDFQPAPSAIGVLLGRRCPHASLVAEPLGDRGFSLVGRARAGLRNREHRVIVLYLSLDFDCLRSVYFAVDIILLPVLPRS